MTNKDYKMMDQGMLLAVDKFLQYERDGKNPTEELIREMKRRGVTKIPWCYTNEQANKLIGELSKNMYSSMVPIFFDVLGEDFEFTREDIYRLKEIFDAKVEQILDLDYLGEHYVTLQDYAKEMNEKYDLMFDEERVKNCQYQNDNAEHNYHYAKVERIIQLLNETNFTDAADFLNTRLLDYNSIGA